MLLYLVSVSDFPRTECGLFCSLIVDFISKSAMVLFIMLRASYYNYNKGPLKVELILCKTIHSGLLLIVVLHLISLRWVIKIVLIFILVRLNNKKVNLCAIFHWPTMILLILSCFILNFHGKLFFSLISCLWYLEYFLSQFFWSSQRNQ